ncbi:MAG: hypothetical protein F7B95_00730 [Desulfurococcales archaeon]|nr:hypothetical protein [Desulfurococcales archaeon]
MPVLASQVSGSEVERLRAKLHERLKDIIEVLVDDAGFSVTAALSDDEIEELVFMVLKEAKRPLTWRELKAIFSGVVGEDRLRKILLSLKARNEVAELTRTRYSLPEYIPPEEFDKVKNPIILKKIRGEIEAGPAYQ